MDILVPYLSAFLVGLLGGVHCVGMCGGIVGALTFGLAEERRDRIGSMMLYQLAYNLGRITSYAIAGSLMGALGLLIVQFLPVYYAQRTLLVVAGLFMVLMGLYLAGWWMLLSRLERAGGTIWRRVEPLGRRLLPVRTPLQALGVGLIWGWVPCGLVYSMLVTAVSSGSALEGAGLMLAFALGTLPNLLVVGVMAGAAARLTRSGVFRQVAGGTVILFGLYTLWQAI